MKVSLIHGQSHKGSSYNISRQILDKLPAEDMELSEFFLPKDGPGYCAGCCRCFKEGESCKTGVKTEIYVPDHEDEPEIKPMGMEHRENHGLWTGSAALVIMQV